MSKLSMYVFLLSLLMSQAVYADNLGSIGETFPIQEKSILQLIHERLGKLQESGELDKLQQKMTSDAKNRIERPKPVAGLSPATKDKTFTIDPSITLSRDVKDAKGNIIYPVGTHVNPLDSVTLKSKLIFFDADNPDQRKWVEKHYRNHPLQYKLVLVNGNVIRLIKDWHQQLYFDQQGKLITFFHISYTPAIVEQQGKRLQITEVKLS